MPPGRRTKTKERSGPSSVQETVRCSEELRSAHLAAELVFHGEVNKADTGGDEGVDESDGVQPGLELGRHHAHEDLPTEGLHTVLPLHPLTDTLCRRGAER